MVDRIAGDEARGIWDFDECSGTMAGDRSGNGYVGTLVGSPSWSTDTPSGIGCSILFNGANYVTLANSALLDVGQTFTISAWIKPDSVVGWRDVFMGGNGDIGLGFNAVNGGVMRVTKVNTVDATPSTLTLTLASWHHVAAVFSAGSLTYYLDGKEAGRSTFSQSFVSSAKRIGARGTSSGSFAGRIDQVRVFTKNLTAAEVGLIFATESSAEIAAR